MSFALLLAVELQFAVCSDRFNGSISGHCSLIVHRWIFQPHFANFISLKRNVNRKRKEIPVQRFFVLLQLPKGIWHQCEVACVIVCIHSEVGWIALSHIVGVRPELLDAQTPAAQVTDSHMRVIANSNDISDTNFGICFVLFFVRILLEGVAIRNLPGPLFHLELRSRQQIPDLYRIIHGYITNGTVYRGGEADGGLFSGCKLCIVLFPNRNKFFVTLIPAAIVSVRIKHMVGIHVRHIWLGVKFRAKIQAEIKDRGIVLSA